MMLEELERRDYSESTKRPYVQTIKDLARHFKRPPDQLEPPWRRVFGGAAEPQPAKYCRFMMGFVS